MTFNLYRIKIQEISDLKQKKLAKQQYPKYFIFPCEQGHLKKMDIWDDEPIPDLLSVQNVLIFQ